jgi:hypothetical protein
MLLDLSVIGLGTALVTNNNILRNMIFCVVCAKAMYSTSQLDNMLGIMRRRYKM